MNENKKTVAKEEGKELEISIKVPFSDDTLSMDSMEGALQVALEEAKALAKKQLQEKKGEQFQSGDRQE